MSTPIIVCEFVDITSTEKNRMRQLIRQVQDTISEPNDLGILMTALAHASPTSITEVRMWLDNTKGPDGNEWDSSDVVSATGCDRIIGSPTLAFPSDH